MSNSLQDQLVKAGLATRAQADKARKQQRAEELAQRRPKKNANQKQVKDQPAKRKNTVAEKAQQLNQQKAQRHKAADKSRQDKYAQRALRAEIRQLIQENDQRQKSPGDDAVAYNFVHGKKIKRLYVTPAERDKLSSGKLIVINNDGVYHFVIPDIAGKIEQRDPKRIIVAHGQGEGDKQSHSSADDEYYAQFEVPDDLDW